MIRTRAALALAVAVAVDSPVAAQERAESTPTSIKAEVAPIPFRWMPDWLMDALRRAIADASDTRDRDAGR